MEPEPDRLAKLVQRSLIRRQFDLLDAQQTVPLRLVTQTILERTLRILLAQVHVDRFIHVERMTGWQVAVQRGRAVGRDYPRFVALDPRGGLEQRIRWLVYYAIWLV